MPTFLQNGGLGLAALPILLAWVGLYCLLLYVGVDQRRALISGAILIILALGVTAAMLRLRPADVTSQPPPSTATAPIVLIVTPTVPAPPAVPPATSQPPVPTTAPATPAVAITQGNNNPCSPIVFVTGPITSTIAPDCSTHASFSSSENGSIPGGLAQQPASPAGSGTGGGTQNAQPPSRASPGGGSQPAVTETAGTLSTDSGPAPSKIGALIVYTRVEWNATRPDANVAFPICLGGATLPTPDCHSIGSAGGDLNWSNLLAGGYSVQPPAPGPPWTVWIDTATIAVAPDGTAKVHIKLTHAPPRTGALIVHVEVDWDHTAPDANVTFPICLGGAALPTPDCHSVGSAGGDLNWSNLLAGGYSIQPPAPDPPWAVWIDTATITVAPDGTAKVHIKLTHAPPPTGALIVHVEVDWNHTTPDANVAFLTCLGGAALPTPDCHSVGSDGGDLNWSNLLAGGYSIQPPAPGPPWSVSADKLTITVAPDSIAGMYIKLTHAPPPVGALIVHVEVDWNRTAPDANVAFPICLSGAALPTPDCHSVGSAGGDLNWSNLLAGGYSIQPPAPGPPWSVSADKLTITVAPDGTAEMYIKLTHAPPPIGALIVHVEVDWNHTAPDANTAFPICLGGAALPTPDCHSVGSAGGDLNWSNLLVGDYTVQPPAPGPPWSVSADKLTITVAPDGTAEMHIKLTHAPPPEDVTCTLVEDTFVESSESDTKYGRDDDLESDGRPGSIAETLLRFSCSQSVHAHQAIIELWIQKDAEQSANISVTNGAWSEATTNWENRPNHHDRVIGTIGPTKAGRISIPIDTSMIDGNTINLTIWIAQNDNYREAKALHFASREYRKGERKAALVLTRS